MDGDAAHGSAKLVNVDDDVDHEFAHKLDEIINHNATGLSLSIGYRVGLVQTMAELEEPKTSMEIAEKAGLNERYVREWLAVMVVSKFIIVNKDDNTYFLPRNRVKCLQSPIKQFSTVKMFEMFPPLFGELEACFKNGGGISYDKYEGFHKVMDAMSAQGHRENLLQYHIPSIEGLHEKLESGIKCLDIGCGFGSPGLLMSRRYPNSEIYGFDISQESIQYAQGEAEKLNLKNAHFLVKDCSKFDPAFTETFDYIFAHDAIHDQAQPGEVLSCIFKMLKKDGLFSMVDVKAHSHPSDNIGITKAAYKYTVSLFHCMPVSLYFDGGAGLGTCWGMELAVKMLKEVGFNDVDIRPYHGDSFNIHYVVRK